MGWFNTIQAAIDNATNGSTILIGDGTYTENIIVNKTLTIKPFTGENVIIQAAESEDSDSEYVDVITITSAGSGSTIQGLTIKGSDSSYGIYLDSANSCNINGNTITNNECGIYLYMSNNTTISGNILRDNYYGIGFYNSTSNNISLNNLTDNYYGNYFENSHNNTISGNNVTDNWDGIHLYQSNDNTLSSNYINGNWIGSYLFKSNNTGITGNNITDNGCGICDYDSNNTAESENNITYNWIANKSTVDSNNMIVATTIYTCGPAALATVLKNLGVNATEEELAISANTTETGTTMYGLQQAAINKGFLNTNGYKLRTDQLQANYIVVLKINGNYHYNIIRNITNETVYLIDPNLGYIEMNITKFNELFISNLTDSTGYVLIVTNDTLEINGTLMNETEMQDIKAMAYTVKYKWVWVPGYWYSTKKWVSTTYYVPKVYWVWVPRHKVGWGWLSVWIPGHYEPRVKMVKKTTGFWLTTWHYKKGYFKKISYKVKVSNPTPTKTSKVTPSSYTLSLTTALYAKDTQQDRGIPVYCAYTWNPNRTIKKIQYGGWKIIGGAVALVYSPNPGTFITSAGLSISGLQEYEQHYDEVGYGDDWRYNEPLFYIR